MAENKSSLFGIIALIIGASGLGLGAFSVVSFQVVEGPQGIPGDDGLDGIDGINGTLDNLVAIWENLIGPFSLQFFIQVSDIRYNNSNYYYMTNDNQYFHLIVSGWYRFVFRFLLEDLVVGWYYLDVLGVGSGVGEEWIYLHPGPATIYHVNLIFYLHSDGDDYYHFLLRSDAPFSIGHTRYNQLVIEYLGE